MHSTVDFFFRIDDFEYLNISWQKGIRIANRKKKYKIAGINILTQFYVNFIEGGIDWKIRIFLLGFLVSNT